MSARSSAMVSSRLAGLTSSRRSAPADARARATCAPTKQVAPVMKALMLLFYRERKEGPLLEQRCLGTPVQSADLARISHRCHKSIRERYGVSRFARNFRKKLFQRFRLDSDVLLAGGLLLPVLAHPGLKALARGGVAAGEGQRGDL